MHQLLTHWRKICYVACVLKFVSIILLPVGRPPADFGDWTFQTSSLLQTVLAGKLPAVSTYGVYIGIEIVLAPFFWVWTLLPIDHPMITNLVQHTPPTVALALLMKLPIFISDVATLLLLRRIVLRITNSEEKAILAGLTWFVNPFNFIMLYSFGAMDAIPIAAFLLAIDFESRGHWFKFGVSAVVSGLLRLFAFVTYPFFIPVIRTRATRAIFILGSAIPVAIAGTLIYLSRDTLATVFSIPAAQPWLLEFLGWNVLGMQFVRLSPVLVLFQLYLIARFWRRDADIVHLASVSLLALSVGATLYGGEAQHFLWVSPLLSACLAMRLEDSWIYALTFFAAIMAPTNNPFYYSIPEPVLRDTFLAGAFYAMKAIYLLKLNMANFKIPQ